MTYSKITYAIDGPLAIIALNDPATLNALTPVMANDLSDALTRGAGEARCIMLTGAGRGFCSGANLAGFEAAQGQRPDVGLMLEKYYNPLVAKLRDLPVPLVNAINGPAAGAGASLALLGDIIVAAQSAYFLQAFRRIGLVPDAGATYVLPRMTTRARAMELMLLGEKLPAPKALEWGLINRCVPDGELAGAAKAIAHELAAGPTQALALTRKLAWRSLDASWDEQLQAEQDAQRSAGQTADFYEGVEAFTQKRPAAFKGA